MVRLPGVRPAAARSGSGVLARTRSTQRVDQVAASDGVESGLTQRPEARMSRSAPRTLSGFECQRVRYSSRGGQEEGLRDPARVRASAPSSTMTSTSWALRSTFFPIPRTISLSRAGQCDALYALCDGFVCRETDSARAEREVRRRSWPAQVFEIAGSPTRLGDR